MTEVPRPEPVTLTPDEERILDRIALDAGSLRHETAQANGEAVADLMGALLQRDAIPAIRLRYLDDPELNIGGHGSSRLGVFQRNGCPPEDAIRHPHFLPYLHYLLFGPDLPAPVIDGLHRIIEDDPGGEGMVRDQLRRFARAEVRRCGLDRYRASEEFFKLALELGLDRSAAWSIRDAVRNVR